MATGRAVLSRKLCLILLLIVNTTRSENNVAVLKNSSQSSNQGNTDWVASKVVDNCVDTFITNNCCTHTKGGQKQVWWRVDLGNLMTISNIKIFYRDNYQRRFAGYQLYLSNTTDSPTQGVLCYEDESGTLADVQLVVTHQCPHVARYVTVYNYRNDPTRYSWYDDEAILELCEVQVFGCQVGRYGDGNCDSLCPESCYGGNCNSTSGSCFYCFPGKHGDYCNSDCPSTCKGSFCEKDTVFCFECVAGKHGNTCEQDCSVNCKDMSCARDTENCFECIPGKYGNKCEQDCSVNCKDMLCAGDAGKCNACTPGLYGSRCNQMCSGNCKDKLCMQDTGICTDCEDGFFGAGCNSCSSGCIDPVCDKSSGNCSQCNTGFHGTKCDQSCPANCENNMCIQNSGDCTVPTQAASLNTTAVGIGAGFGLIILALVILVIILVRRLTRNQGDNTKPTQMTDMSRSVRQKDLQKNEDGTYDEIGAHTTNQPIQTYAIDENYDRLDPLQIEPTHVYDTTKTVVL